MSTDDRLQMMKNADLVASDIAECGGEAERKQWLSYLFEALEAAAGEDVLREALKLLTDRLLSGRW